MVTIGIAISSQGRPTLYDTLHSVKQQGLITGDLIVVAFDGEPQYGVSADTYAKAFPWAHFVTREADPGAWGHTQMNRTFDFLRGKVDLIGAQDDDDIFAPGAFDAMRMRAAANPGHLLMSRAYNHAWGLLWRTPNWDEELVPGDPAYEGNMAHDGHSVWSPGHAPVLPKFGRPYNGDQEYIQAARLLFWDKTVWCPEITSITRPSHTFGWRLSYWRVSTPEQVEQLRVLRNECREGMTGFTGIVDKDMQRKWWDGNKQAIRAYLIQDGPTPVGFIIIRPYNEGYTLAEGPVTATIGVGKKYRRKGYGREITQLATLAAQRDMYEVVRTDNKPMLQVGAEAGWEVVDSTDKVTNLVCAWPPKFMLREKGQA